MRKKAWKIVLAKHNLNWKENNVMGSEKFGCERCFQAPDAQKVWSKERPFAPVAELVQESHFSVSILRCTACGQLCVKVFTEMIDWEDGDDAQYWSLVPLTSDEADELRAQGENVSTSRIMQLGEKRRYLMADHPSGKQDRIAWAEGNLLIGPHD